MIADMPLHYFVPFVLVVLGLFGAFAAWIEDRDWRATVGKRRGR